LRMVANYAGACSVSQSFYENIFPRVVFLIHLRNLITAEQAVGSFRTPVVL
jgi:hypothetical protein